MTRLSKRTAVHDILSDELRRTPSPARDSRNAVDAPRVRAPFKLRGNIAKWFMSERTVGDVEEWEGVTDHDQRVEESEPDRVKENDSIPNGVEHRTPHLSTIAANAPADNDPANG